MNPLLDPNAENLNNSEKDIEKVLRPSAFDDFTGQDKIIENLKIFVEAAKRRKEALDHVLLHGPPGLGKTTLSHIIANELGVNIKNHQWPSTRQAWRFGGFAYEFRRGRYFIY